MGYEYVTHRDPIYKARSVLAGWISGSTPFWYVLLGVSNLMIGLSLRSRRG